MSLDIVFRAGSHIAKIYMEPGSRKKIRDIGCTAHRRLASLSIRAHLAVVERVYMFMKSGRNASGTILEFPELMHTGVAQALMP